MHHTQRRRGNKNKGHVAAAPRQPLKSALRSAIPQVPGRSSGHEVLRRYITEPTVDLFTSHLQHQAAPPVAAPRGCLRKKLRPISFRAV